MNLGHAHKTRFWCLFNLAKGSCQEVFNLIQKIPSNKTSGLDNISARLLKEASPIVTRSLTFIINQSITTGIVPNAWKRARVSPIFKEDLRTDPNNYRPVSYTHLTLPTKRIV